MKMLAAGKITWLSVLTWSISFRIDGYLIIIGLKLAPFEALKIFTCSAYYTALLDDVIFTSSTFKDIT